MMRKLPLPAVLVAALALSAVAPAAHSAGWGNILRDGPVEDFSDEDVSLYMDAIKQTLETGAVSQPVEWRNPDSRSGGTLVVLGKPKMKDFEECRRVRTTVYSKKSKGVPSVWTACKEPAGRWRLVSVG